MNRKSFTFAALSVFAIAFTACTANEDIDQLSDTVVENNAITFQVKNSPARSASPRDMSTSVSDFKVSALDGASSYFGSTPMSVFSTDNGSSWTSSNKTYWPTGRPADWQGLTFVAYVDQNPTRNSFNLNEGSATFTNYEVPADASKHTDLMYAVAKDVKKESSNGNVSLQFRHALAQISFSAQNNSPVYENIEILSIELGGVKGKGSYSFPEASTSASARGTWTLDENVADRSFKLEGLGVNLGACDSSLKGEKVAISSTTRSEKENVMMLIPQTVEEGAYIKVKTRMTLAGFPDNSYTSEEIIPISANWKEGQQYNYNIAWNATPINFSVSVSDFREVTVDADL